jgi:hypothetical protein
LKVEGLKVEGLKVEDCTPQKNPFPTGVLEE